MLAHPVYLQSTQILGPSSATHRVCQLHAAEGACDARVPGARALLDPVVELVEQIPIRHFERLVGEQQRLLAMLRILQRGGTIPLERVV